VKNFKLFFYIYSHKIFFWLFILIFICQVFFWRISEKYRVNYDIVPPAPSRHLVKATSFGDEEFLFRILALRLQNSGDIFAGFVSLKKYDYSRIYDWMTILDKLNFESRIIPSLASYYYSQSSILEHKNYILKYLDEHSSRDIDKNWWWLFQATFIAKKDLNDLDKALYFAQKLAKNEAKEAPLWTKQMPAFISEKKGDGCMALKVIKNLIDESESGKRQISAEEMNFMRHFINNRLSKLKKQNFNANKC
jgi:hypothetical protein